MTSVRKYLPDHSAHDHIRVAPRILAEELHRHFGITDEGPENPGHLDAHESVKEEPETQQPTVDRIAAHQGAIDPPQHELRGEAGHAEYDPIEEDGFTVTRKLHTASKKCDWRGRNHWNG